MRGAGLEAQGELGADHGGHALQDAPSFLPCRISALLRRPPAGATSTARPGILPCPVPLISVPSSDRGSRTSRIAQVIDKEDLS